MINFSVIEWIAGIIGTITAGYIVYRMTAKRLKINYYLTETDSFDTEEGYIKYYTLKIANAGNKLIESIHVDISFHDGKIGKITDNRLIEELNKSDENISFNIQHLNPNENLNCIITVLESKKGTSKPTITIRGKGANATDKSSSLDRSGDKSYGIAIGFFLGIGLIMGLVYAQNPSTDKQDKIETIFFTLNKAGASHIFPKVISIDDNISYVGTGFQLIHGYLKDTGNSERYINALKGISELDDISQNSKGVILYLIYKIKKREKNIVEATEYLQKCKTETPVIYRKLMENDKYYDLNNLQLLLKNNGY